MINFESACEVASSYYSEKMGVKGIYQPKELEDCWVFNGGAEGDQAVGISKIAVSKQDGCVSLFLLPSKENFARLKEAASIELPERYR